MFHRDSRPPALLRCLVSQFKLQHANREKLLLVSRQLLEDEGDRSVNEEQRAEAGQGQGQSDPLL